MFGLKIFCWPLVCYLIVVCNLHCRPHTHTISAKLFNWSPLNDYDSLVLGTGQYSPVFGRIGYCMILLLAVL